MNNPKILQKVAMLFAVVGLITLLYTALDGVKTSSYLENFSYISISIGVVIFILSENFFKKKNS